MINRNIIRIVFSFVFILGTASGLYSQKIQIKGIISDTSIHKNIGEASVVILNAKDSFLLADTRSDKDGVFKFGNFFAGKYLLLVSYPGYTAFVDTFTLDRSSSKINFSPINLQLKSILLKEVIIGSAKAAIRFKGDTTEFNADSFHVPKNASVEDLLRQLPGLQVDRSGHIKANGRAIEKVLVDGEEFFGDDPTLVTRNLRADLVEAVQLYDGTSDKTSFTDSEKKVKTLNLKLKEDKKNGYFGKAEVSQGTNGYYQHQGMFNSFTEKRKLSAYFNLSNTGVASPQQNQEDDYNSPIENNLDTWSGTYDGTGIPKSIGGGLHYDKKWDDDKQYAFLNYKLGNLNLSGAQNTQTQNNSPENILYTTERQNSRKQIFRQGLNAAYEIKPSSASHLKFSMAGVFSDKTVNDSSYSVTQKENKLELNNSERNTSVNTVTKALKTNILWEKKFKRERRTLAVNFNATVSENSGSGYFFTNSNFFDESGVKDSSQVVDQFKKTKNNMESYWANMVYTEPFWKYASIAFNYGFSVDNAKSELLSFNKSSREIYNNLDSSYSNSYNFKQSAFRGGLFYVYHKRKIRIRLGSDAAINQFNQEDLVNNSVLKRSFTNWYPNAQFAYEFSSSKTISLNYTGTTIQPEIHQIQPVSNNKDPLNIFVGNKNLVPFFNNTLSFSYNAFDDANSGFLRIDFRLSEATNPITTSIQTNNNSGKNVYTFVNLPGQKSNSYFGNFLYTTKTKIWDLNFGLNADAKGNRYVSISNDKINISNEGNYGLSFTLSRQQPHLYSAGIGFGPEYDVNRNSLQPQINNNSWGYRASFDIDLFLPFDFIIHTDGDYKWQGKTQTFTEDFKRFLWNASIGKKVLKNKNLLFKISANDILNQNIGFVRNINNNISYQNNYLTISRYFLASVIWDFNRSTVK